MALFADVMVFVVAAMHCVFFVLESLLWTAPRVRALFGNSEEEAEATRVLAVNQGGYNLGLAIILVWLHVMGNPAAVMVVLFLIVAMGVLGAITASRIILLLQSLPALTAAILVWMVG